MGVRLILRRPHLCVLLSNDRSPIARAIGKEVHWYHFDVKHGWTESVLREVQRVCHVIGGHQCSHVSCSGYQFM